MCIKNKEWQLEQGKACIQADLRALGWLARDIRDGRTKADRGAAFEKFAEALEKYYGYRVWDLEMKVEHFYGDTE